MDRKSKEFKQLQAKWYSKLEKSGFKDIEHSEDLLKNYDAHHIVRNYNRFATGESKIEYYTLAGHFLYDFVFKSKKDELIWKAHAEGSTIRATAKMLFQALQVKTPISTIAHRIKVLRKQFFEYIKEQHYEQVGSDRN